MTATPLLRTDLVRVTDVLCAAGPDSPSVVEHHTHHSLAFVRAGSFACRCGREDFDMVRGSVLVGSPGREFTCSHIHRPHGDRCLSVQIAPTAVDMLGGAEWGIGTLAPTAEMPVLARLIEARARQRHRLGLEEAALLAVARFGQLGRRARSARRAPNPRERRLAVSAALWLEAQAGEETSLGEAAAQAGLSPFHFLRVFSRTLGVTPHQYLLRVRLDRAARLLGETELPVTEVAFEAGYADLSNFVRAFGRAAGMSPRAFRRSADRKNFQVSPARAI
ncbi:AraC family transcriptional regulator [Roseococcus sp. SYP-B2431]|nr:AraC family transcriptional regulator [Roseococcus sp. SYP-B2431]